MQLESIFDTFRLEVLVRTLFTDVRVEPNKYFIDVKHVLNFISSVIVSRAATHV
jgi:hypothetical protein